MIPTISIFQVKSRLLDQKNIFDQNSDFESDDSDLDTESGGGKTLSLSKVKYLKGFKEFVPGESLLSFLKGFFYGKSSDFSSITLTPQQVKLIRVLLIQRVPPNHNRWLLEMINSMDEKNVSKVCGLIQDRVKLHRTNIAGHFIFSKLVLFCRGRSDLAPLDNIEMPKKQIFSVQYFKTMFSAPGFKESFVRVVKSPEFRDYIVEFSKSRFDKVIKSVLFAAQLVQGDSSVKIVQKVNLGLSFGQIEKIMEPFKKYIA